MSRGLPKTVKDNLEKSRHAAIAAVDAYNRPGPRFRTAQFIVMIAIAWTAAFHAVFYKAGRRPWYRKKSAGGGTGVRYQRIDGEPRHWDLAECLKNHFQGENPPERVNLKFLIGLRNKIEHRHLPEMDATLYGECQASLLNLEDFLVQNFGQRYALAEQLAVSLQFSRTTPAEKKKAAQVLASTSARSVRDYVEQFRGGIAGSTLNSMKYSFSVFLVPKVANRKSAADVAIEFVRVDEASEEELDRVEKLNVLIREKHIPIANFDLYKPSEVVQKVSSTSPFKVTMGSHTAAWRHYGVRPPSNSSRPQDTRSEFCVFDAVHRDYMYSKAWIEKLSRDFSDRDTFEKVVGREPQKKAD